MANEELVPVEYVEERILTIRGQRIILDADLAELYGVETKTLNQAVARNKHRFPEDFVFRLSVEEFADLRSQTVTSSWGGRRIPPNAFSEYGAIMAANILRSERAIEMSVFVVRAFVRLRGVLASQAKMLRKLEELEERVGAHDEAIQSIVVAIRQLMAPDTRTPQIGFASDE